MVMHIMAIQCIVIALLVGRWTANQQGCAIEPAEEGDLPGEMVSIRAAVSNLEKALLDERHEPDDAKTAREEALQRLQEALQNIPDNEAADPCAEENLRYTLSAKEMVHRTA